MEIVSSSYCKIYSKQDPLTLVVPMTLTLSLLLWLIGGGLLASLVEMRIIRMGKKPNQQATPFVKIGVVLSLLRMLLLCGLLRLLFEPSELIQVFKILVLADVLATAIHAIYSVRRYGFNARRSGYRTGCNLGSLLYGCLFFLWL